MARIAKSELEKLKERIRSLELQDLEILVGYAGAVLDVRESDAAKVPPEAPKPAEVQESSNGQT